MKTHSEPARDIPIYATYDVVVVGGGCAGFAAAVAAARNGARTLIIERFPYFGGTATASLMANINGFRNQVEPDDLQTTKGIGEELMLRMIEAGAVGRSPYPQKHYPGTRGQLSYSYAIDTERFKYETLRMAVDAGLSILFHTWFADAIIVEAGKHETTGTTTTVVGVIIENKSGRQAVFASVVIDASGDGDVAARAGATFWQTTGDEASRLNDGLMYRVTGIASDAELHGCQLDTTAVLWGPGAEPANGVDADDLTAQEISTRLAVYDNLAAKQKEEPALAGARIIETPPLLGIRQTRFIDGVYQITGDDVIGGVLPPDSVAMGSSPIIHYYGYRRFLEHSGYGIPYRCLVPNAIDGLLVAGRCISSDQRAYESWRAMAHVLAIGEAAGTAAAMSASAGVEPRGLDPVALRHELIRHGAEVGTPSR